MQRVRAQIGLTDKISSKWTGKGITVAILDTGIAWHPDFGNRILSFYDFVNSKSYNGYYDDCGHGTHVAGCLGGSGQLSHGKYRGVAPKINYVVGKVLDRNGEGTVEDMISGIEWIMKVKDIYQIRILNISIGISNIQNKSLEEKLIKKLLEAYENGIMIVVAAGNKGPAPMTVSAIGEASEFLTVGCHDGDYKCDHLCEYYSGRGPTKDKLKKPDIVAPGTDIMSCSINRNKPYVRKCGTSMATPIVSGAVALYMEKYQAYSNAQIKRLICTSAKNLGEKWNKQGWGMLNLNGLL